MALALIGDIGGTNSRFGLVEQGSNEVKKAQSLKNDNFSSLEAVIQYYVSQQGHPPLRDGAIAVAAPVDREHITLTNREWTFSSTSLAAAAGAQQMQILNDYEALALGLPYLDEKEDLILIGGIPTKKREVKIVLGPGTGLGMAALVPAKTGWQVVPCEPGHITLPIETQEEFNWRQKMQKQGVMFTAEDAITGGGLYHMYKTLKPQTAYSTPEEVLAAGLAGNDEAAVLTLHQFMVWLARICGDAGMLLQARGGVYLAGGIAPSLVHLLETAEFRHIFEQKGKLAAVMKPIPVYIIIDKYPAFKGCIAALREKKHRQ